MPIEIKKNAWLWVFSAFLVAATFALVWHKDVTFKEGAAFVTGALAMPALFGTKKKDDDDDQPPGQTPVLVDDTPAPSVQQLGPHKLPGIITPVTRSGPYREQARRHEKPPPTPVPQPPRPLSAWSMRGALLVGCAALSACAAAHDPRVQAEESYTGEQTKCAATEPSRAAIDACRERARIKWNVPARDGGAR